MSANSIIGEKSSDIEHLEWNISATHSHSNSQQPQPSSHHMPNVVRFGSSSSQTSQSSGDICRICHCESDPQNPLLTPCYCAGSLKYVHQACLQQWLTASETNSCELCKFPFIMHTKIKPFNEWRSLDMSGVERRRLFCAVLFHCAAALCVIWSLCVLIERAAEEVKRGLIGWPFWTKLVVVTVGLTGGVVFMYIQCRQYMNLCNRWRARNRILLIQNAPEKVHPSTLIAVPSPTLALRSLHHPSNASLMPSRAGQIVANIENSALNYQDADWNLDECSQASMRQAMASGVQVHGVSGDSSVTSDDTIGVQVGSQPVSSSSSKMASHDLNMFRVIDETRSSNTSAVFLENNDILNDECYPKLINHRHSSVLCAHADTTDSLSCFLGPEVRRSSDTKLMSQKGAATSDVCLQLPIFNVSRVLGGAIPSNCNQHSGDQTSEQFQQPQITDITFENTDPLETNIRDVLVLDSNKKTTSAGYDGVSLGHSMGHLPNAAILTAHKNNEDWRKCFKSLPNLSASSENLLRK